MSRMNYEIKQSSEQRWGIYQDERLLATVGSYEACESIWKYLQQELSYPDNIRSRMSYRNALDRNLLVSSVSMSETV